ncbi:hypothetical protein FKP32DRAFT_1457723 [Trametes sanguinea]|nr:hypothetical protein FKP32DRAFT_1457723 [Trametes sanguinea]
MDSAGEACPSSNTPIAFEGCTSSPLLILSSSSTSASASARPRPSEAPYLMVKSYLLFLLCTHTAIATWIPAIPARDPVVLSSHDGGGLEQAEPAVDGLSRVRFRTQDQSIIDAHVDEARKWSQPCYSGSVPQSTTASSEGPCEQRRAPGRGPSVRRKRANVANEGTLLQKLPTLSRFIPNIFHAPTIPIQPIVPEGAIAQGTPLVSRASASFQPAVRPAELSSSLPANDPISVTLLQTTSPTTTVADRPAHSATPEDKESNDPGDNDTDPGLVHTLLTVIIVESVVIFLLLVALIWLVVVLRRKRQARFVELQGESPATPKPAPDAPTPADEVPFIDQREESPSRQSCTLMARTRLDGRRCRSIICCPEFT